MPDETSPPTVTVWGEAVLRTEPDEAVLLLTLSALEESPGPAVADVTARSASLVELLDEFGVTKADRSTTGVTVEEEYDHTKSGRRLLGHRANAHMSIRLADPEQVGQLIARATDELSARVHGLRWLVSLDNPVRLEATRRAAADAERKARAYAEGVGAGLGPLIRLSESGGAEPVMGRVARTALSAGAMPVEAGEQAVTASIEATFALALG
jgi:uncharacterized protein YggE